MSADDLCSRRDSSDDQPFRCRGAQIQSLCLDRSDDGNDDAWILISYCWWVRSRAFFSAPDTVTSWFVKIWMLFQCKVIPVDSPTSCLAESCRESSWAVSDIAFGRARRAGKVLIVPTLRFHAHARRNSICRTFVFLMSASTLHVCQISAHF